MTYQQQLDAYEDEILRLGALRNAQLPDSDHWHYYQDKVSACTDRKRALEGALPVLEAADRDLREWSLRCSREQRDADAAATVWRRSAKVTGAVGLVCVVVVLLGWGGSLPPVLAGMFLAVAAGSVLYGSRVQRIRSVEVDVGLGQLAAAQARKKALLASVQAHTGPLLGLFDENDSVEVEDALADVD